MNRCKNTYCTAAKTKAAPAAISAISLSLRERYCNCSGQHGEVEETTPEETENGSATPARYWPLLADMPPLSHWPDRCLPYHDDRSEVLAHIRERFGVSMDLAGRIFRYANYKGVIRFNRDTRLWCGLKGGAA